MNRFSILLFSVLCLSLFLAGCGPSQNDAVMIGGFVGGDSGLEMKLTEGAPPQVIQDKRLTPFAFVLDLENAGEAPVGPGTDNPLILARLSGFIPSDFNLAPADSAKQLQTRLEPAKRNFDGSVTQGSIDYVSWENLAYVPDVFDSLAMKLRAEICYDYESYTTAKICVKNDFIESAEDATICNLRGPRPFGNSGAPLHITNVEEAPISEDTIQVNFNIEHFGRGAFFYRSEYGSDLSKPCRFDDLNPDIYKIEVIVEPIQPNAYDVQCIRLENRLPGGGAYGTVRMPQGAPIAVSCFFKRTRPMQTRLYEDIVNIKLRYRYGEFVEVPVLIQGHA